MNKYFFISLFLILNNTTIIFSMENQKAPQALQHFTKHNPDLSDNEPGCPLPDNISAGCIRCLQIMSYAKAFSPQGSMFSGTLRSCVGCLKSVQNIRLEIPDEIPACGLGASAFIAGCIAVNEITSALSAHKKVKTE